jgi:hypothetical protein
MKRGIVATAVKGAFKIYLVPAMRTRNALATVTGGWHELVAEARQEHEARKQADELGQPQPHAEPALVVPASTPPAAEPRKRRRSMSRRPIRPRQASDSLTTDAGPDETADRPEGAMEESPFTPELAQAEDAGTPSSPTLVEAGESSVEVRPNPAISPVHVTSGVIAHLSPEVRHRLAGDGPIRA